MTKYDFLSAPTTHAVIVFAIMEGMAAFFGVINDENLAIAAMGGGWLTMLARFWPVVLSGYQAAVELGVIGKKKADAEVTEAT